MKKMFNKKFFIIFGSTITLLIVLSVAMIFLTKENTKTFTREGYIIASGNSEDSSVKYYFDEGTSYKKNISSQLVFTDTSGEKVTVETDNFMHYIDGGIKFLKNGVIMDLNSVNTSTVPYYNITNKSVLEYSKKSYYIETIDKTLAFNNIAGRISDNKYIFAGTNVKLQLAGNENLIEGDYFEVTYIEDGIVKIENQEVSYQTTAENSYLLVDDTIRIDLGNKKIYYDGEEKMSLSQMTIDGNENIEIVPEEDEEDNDGSGGGEGDGTDTGEDQTGTEGTDGENDNPPDVNQPGTDPEEPTDGEETEPGIEDGEQGEGDGTGTGTGTSTQRNASVEIVKAEVGVNNISASFIVNDPDNTIKGDLVLHITNTDTGKRVYSTVIDKTKSEVDINVSTLSPDSNYILSINEETNEEYDTQYFQKLFKTESLDIALEKKYTTQDSLAYEVVFGEETEVASAKISLYDKEYQPVSESVVVTKENNIAYFENLTSNTTYNIVLDDIIMNSFEYNQVYSISKTTKTLKQTPYLEGLTTSVDDETNTFTVGVDRVVDIDESITKYSYYIYKADDITQENIDTLLPVKIIEKNDKGKVNIGIDNENILPKTNYKFKIVAEYYDNEKYGEFETELSDNFILSGKPTIEFIKDEQNTSFNKISGTIILTDDSCTVPMNGRSCSSIKKYENNFSLEYKIINSTEKVTLNEISFNPHTLEASIEIDNLLANTEYIFNLYGDVDLLDGQGLRKKYLIGTFRASTSTIEILTVDWDWDPTKATTSDLINVSARISPSGENKDLGSSIQNLTLNLYSGDVAAELKAGAVIEPLKSKQLTGELAEAFYNNFSVINTKDTFEITDQTREIIDEETGEVIGTETIKAIEVLKAMTHDSLLNNYTIEITDVYDAGFTNKLQIENNYFKFVTPPLFLMEYSLETPKITAESVENITLDTDTELADALGTKYNKKLLDNTIVGYKLNAVASLDRMFSFLPIKELIYYVCDANEDADCTVENAVMTKSIDVNQTTNLATTLYVDYGTKYGTTDEKLTRGHDYIFKLKFSVDTDNDGEADAYYPTTEVETGIMKTPKQAPSYSTYIVNSTENTADYAITFDDIDNALYEDKIYYTIDDELKNSIIEKEEEPTPEEGENPEEVPGEENPTEGEGTEGDNSDDTTEEVPEETPEIKEPVEYTADIKNCSLGKKSYKCFQLTGLSNDSVYTLKFKRALTKTKRRIENTKIGEYIFDGELKYDSNTVTYANITFENDNRLRIKINETLLNQSYVNRIAAYKVTLAVDGAADGSENDYVRYYPTSNVSTCTEGEGENEISYRCVIVDYADIKNFKSQNITIGVSAYYDNGIIDNSFYINNNDNSISSDKYYLLQNNNVYNKNFTRGSYVYLDGNMVKTAQYPNGIYAYKKTGGFTTKAITYIRKIDPTTNTLADFSYDVQLAGTAGDSIYISDYQGKKQSINNKELSTVTLSSTNSDTFKFNSIIPKIAVSTKQLVNGTEITITPSGLDKTIVSDEFKEEDGKYYYYLDVYLDEEKTQLYKTIKQEVTISGDAVSASKVTLTGYMPDTKYYFEVFSYLKKADGSYKRTQLFNNTSNTYVTKTYEFTTRSASTILRGSPSILTTHRAYSEDTTYLKRELNLTMKSAQNIGEYTTIFEVYQPNSEQPILKLENIVPGASISYGIDESVAKVDITDKDYIFGNGYYTIKVYIQTTVDEQFEEDGLAELLVYEDLMNLSELEEPTYSITDKNAGLTSLEITLDITDNSRVIKNGEYCVALLDALENPIKGKDTECFNLLVDGKIVKNKTLTYTGLNENTVYLLKVYSNIYRNNISLESTEKNKTVTKNFVLTTSSSQGVALGQVAAYATKNDITLSFNSGINLNKIKKIEYTLYEQKSESSGTVAIAKETYNIGNGTNDLKFQPYNNGDITELVLKPKDSSGNAITLSSGSTYSLYIVFWVEVSGSNTLQQLGGDGHSYNYNVKFR